MADIASGIAVLFRLDPDGACDFMLENMEKIRDYTGDPDPQADGAGHDAPEQLAVDRCQYCGSTEMLLYEAEGDVCCVDCGTCARYIDDTIRAVDYDAQVQLGADYYFMPKKSEYKRMQHFCDILNQLQDRRDVDVPAEVLLQVRERLDSHHAGKKRTLRLVRAVLKETGYGYKQYENAQAILNKLTKYDKATVLEIPHDVERDMKDSFMMVENAWKRLPANGKASRKSFLSYSYVIRQLLRALGHGELAARIPTIKSKTRIRSHDQAWEQICKLCKFPFSPLLPTL